MKKNIFKKILNQSGSTLMTVIAMVGIVGAGAYILPDIMKGAKKSIIDLENKMKINQFSSQMVRYLGRNEICVENFKPSNLNQIAPNKWEVKDLIAIDGNNSVARIAQPGNNIARGKGYLKLKNAYLEVTTGSLDNTVANHFDANFELVFETRDYGKKVEVSSIIPLNIVSVEVDSVTGDPVLPYNYLVDGQVISCNGITLNINGLANLCKTLFGGVYNETSGQCDHLLITDEPCIEYDSSIVGSHVYSYDVERRRCVNGGGDKDLGYQINIAPTGCGKGTADPTCSSSITNGETGILRVNNELDIDGVKFVYCDPLAPAPTSPVAPMPSYFPTQKKKVCQEVFGASSPPAGILVYNLKSLRAQNILADTVLATGYFRLSDEKAKYEMKNISDEEIEKLGGSIIPRQYKRGKLPEYGFIAQEVETVYPHIVGEKKGFGKTVNYFQFIPLLVGSAKQENKRVESIKEKLKRLENEML